MSDASSNLQNQSPRSLVSVVVPVYFNAESLPILYTRLNDVSKRLAQADFEFVFVDDGSGDNSFSVLHSLSLKDSRVKIVKLSKNFGSFVACLAGLNYSQGHCAVIIAADLQDPPELIERFYASWKNGTKVVCAVRASREENFFKVAISNIYYRLLRTFALKDMPKGGFDSVLIDRQVIDVVTRANEKNTSLMGLILWSGFKRENLLYTKEERKHGRSRWTLSKKIKYFIDSFLGFTYLPIRFISFAGLIVALLSFAYGAFVILQAMTVGIEVKGFPTLIVIVLFTSGLQMLMLGVVGEYIWRSLEETRKRPVFIVDETVGVDISLKNLNCEK